MCRKDTGDWSGSKPTSLKQDPNGPKLAPGLIGWDCEGKSFSRLCILKDHIMSHGTERPFHCDVCGKSFQKKGTLTQHKYLHTGLRPYVCTKCGKAFAQSSTLRCHMKIHK
uniref:C2H2-type domain-containing protein n=1 Tax=Timema bartmani TaxID=61472 RepID=A0A7R9I7H4_9NEOP|nr:unnamed protein product [Timema bartmani]